MSAILLLNGPNLNLLGTREPEVYGHTTLPEVVAHCEAVAEELGHELQPFQSNSEGDLITTVQQAPSQGVDIAVVNPGGLTHTSVALRDAFLAVDLPFIEVHLTNIHAREPFRHHSYLSDIAEGVVCGLGVKGYEWAIRSAHDILNELDEVDDLFKEKKGF